MIRILIVDDNAVVRNGLAMLIASQPYLEATLTAEDGATALNLLLDDNTIDIVLTDFNMPEMDGVELTSRILKMNHRARPIILTMHKQTTFRDKALEAGARGYLLKGEDDQELFDGIRSVHAGNIFVSAGFAV